MNKYVVIVCSVLFILVLILSKTFFRKDVLESDHDSYTLTYQMQFTDVNLMDSEDIIRSEFGEIADPIGEEK